MKLLGKSWTELIQRPRSKFKTVSLKDDQDDITEDAIAASAVQPDKIVKDCDAAAASEL